MNITTENATAAELAEHLGVHDQWLSTFHRNLLTPAGRERLANTLTRDRPHGLDGQLLAHVLGARYGELLFEREELERQLHSCGG